MLITKIQDSFLEIDILGPPYKHRRGGADTYWTRQ